MGFIRTRFQERPKILHQCFSKPCSPFERLLITIYTQRANQNRSIDIGKSNLLLNISKKHNPDIKKNAESAKEELTTTSVYKFLYLAH